MKKRIAIFSLILVASFSVVIASAQDDPSKRPSPAAQAQCKFNDGKSITVDYSSPRVKSRKIFGELVPYGQIWRTGANDATTFVTDANLIVGSKDVPAGNYTIFTLPKQDKWTLIINKKTGEWGIPYKYESDELARTEMTVSKPSSMMENFTISFDQNGGTCKMNMTWENTRASVDISEKK
ncbi:MAG: DUF2911 domain-containing protein [Acidobacteriaceae bacterium]